MNDQKMGEYIRNNKKKDYLFLRSVPFYEDGKIVRDFMPEGFDIQLIKKNYYVACVSKASILAGEQEISINKILDFPMVLSSEKWQGCTPLLHVLRQYKTPNVIMTTPSFFSWAQSVAQNVGIGFTQEIFVQIDIIRKVLAESIHLIRLKEHIGAYLGVILPPKPSTEVQYFHNKITSSLADPNWIY